MVLAIAGVAHADDWGPKRDPFDRGVIAKYQAILLQNPYDPALAKLAAMYKRFRTLDDLIDEYESQPDNGAALVVLGRLLEDTKQPALAAYERAWALRPDDRKLAIKIASIERTLHPDKARAAYERALDGDTRKEANQGLLVLARARRDRAAIQTHSKALAELDPKDPKVQLDHGDTMLELGMIDSALDAFTAAEKLSATDPVRRIEAIARRGLALEQRDRLAAEDEYRRAMSLLPRGHYLRSELFGRLVGLHRSAGTLGALLAITLEDWPVATRGVFEWHELAKLYAAVGDEDHAVASLEQAVKRSPEPRLHLELADAYSKARSADALAVLGKLSARSTNDVGILISIAERYAKWGHLALALGAYDKLLRRDPAAADRMLDLVEDSLRDGKVAAATALVRALAPKLRTAETHGRLGRILLEFGHLKGAVTAFDRAIAAEEKPSKPIAIDVWGNTDPAAKTAPVAISDPIKLTEYYRGRAAARDGLKQIDGAVADAEKVLALAGDDPKLRRIARKELVRIVVHASSENGQRAMFVDAWRVAFDFNPPEIEAGYLLLDYYGTAPCDHFVATKRSCQGEVVRIIKRLAKLAEIDPDEIIMIATAYSAAQLHDEAIQILQVLRALAPAREVDILSRIAKVNGWRTPPGMIGLANGEGLVDPEREIAAAVRRHRRTREERDPLRLGIRFGVGEGLRGGGESLASVGISAAAQLGGNTYLTARLDLADRAGSAPFHSFGGSVGIAKSLVSIEPGSLVLGFAERLERRWGEGMSDYGPVGLAGEATLELVGRKIPASIGARLEQGMSDDGRHTALMFEASVLLR